MSRASYRHGVTWIALNDEPGELDRVEIAALISVALLADLFGKAPITVACDVRRARMFHDAEYSKKAKALDRQAKRDAKDEADFLARTSRAP